MNIFCQTEPDYLVDHMEHTLHRTIRVALGKQESLQTFHRWMPELGKWVLELGSRSGMSCVYSWGAVAAMGRLK